LRPEWLVALTQRGATLTVASESLDPLPTFRPSFVTTDCEPLCRVIHKLTPALSCSSPSPFTRPCADDAMAEEAPRNVTELAGQLVEGFAALSGEYQALFDQHRQLESKLSWAKQQVRDEYCFSIAPLPL